MQAFGKSKRMAVTVAHTRSIDYNKYINYMIMFYALILPLSRAGIVLMSTLLLLMWILEGNFKEKFRLLSRSKVIVALALFIGYNLISILWSDDAYMAFEYVKKYWYFIPMLIIYTSIKKENINKTLSLFILGMLISEVIAYGVFFGLWEFKNVSAQNPTPFMHHIEYSVFLAFTALIMLSRIFNSHQLKTKLLYIPFFITITGNLFLTAGRTGQLAFIIGLLVLALMSFKNKLKAVMVFTVLVVTFFSLAFTFSQTFHDRMSMAKNSLLHLEAQNGYCSSWGSRIGAWVVSRHMIEAHPVLGIGIDDNMQNFYHLIRTQYPEMICGGHTLVHMHNQYLQILTQTGIVGLILFLAIFYYIARIRIRDREYRHIKYLYVVITLFAFVSEVLLHRQFNMALFALIVGLLLAKERAEHAV